MNRVVITGMGVVTPLGNSLREFHSCLIDGKSGVDTISLFDVAGLPTRIGGQCFLPAFEHKDRKIDFALHASRSAVDDAGTSLLERHSPELRGLSIGLGLELFDMRDMVDFLAHDKQIPDAARGRMDYLQTPSDACVSLLCRDHELGQVPSVHISACAAGTDAIGRAMLRIRRGECSMMLAGGTDSMLNPLGLGGFCKLSALSTRNDDPTAASRPFDRDRDGFVLGEGAGFLVLERLEDALARDARIYAEILGYANSFDAYSVSEPHPEGRGAASAIRRAIQMAGISPRQISYINAHGTSTPRNDPAETKAVKAVFGEHAHRIPIHSTKSMIGHLIAAAGAVEAVAAVLAADAGVIHPTANLTNPDPACDLDYVSGEAREQRIDYFLSQSFAFGGQNAALVFRKWEDGS